MIERLESKKVRVIEESSDERYKFERSPYEKQEIDSVYKYKKVKTSSTIKTPLIIIILVLVIVITSGYFLYHVATQNTFDWDKFGGNPWDDNIIPWEKNTLPWTENLKIESIIEPLTSSYAFSDIGIFGTDYWFSGNNIKTNEGWTFEYNKVKNCNFDAIVLNYYVYNKDGLYYYPSEIFSPLDIFFGHDDVVDNFDDYKYSILNNYYRMVRWTCHSDNCAYFRAHTTNTHLIAHNENALNNMKNIEIGSVVNLTGSYVNIYGRHSSENKRYSWTTDDTIGNSNCEIILVDSFTIK